LIISENKAHIQNLQRLLINHELYDKKCLILSSFFRYQRLYNQKNSEICVIIYIIT